MSFKQVLVFAADNHTTATCIALRVISLYPALPSEIQKVQRPPGHV